MGEKKKKKKKEKKKKKKKRKNKITVGKIYDLTMLKMWKKLSWLLRLEYYFCLGIPNTAVI